MSKGVFLKGFVLMPMKGVLAQRRWVCGTKFLDQGSRDPHHGRAPSLGQGKASQKSQLETNERTRGTHCYHSNNPVIN